jgi:hypothetical protein
VPILFLISALLTLLVGLPCRTAAQGRSAPSGVRAQTGHDSAAVVLVGSPPTSAELKQVVSELLLREGIEPSFSTTEQFNSEALLAAPDRDQRVHVYITLPTSSLAKLYLRGPHGQRFILRELSLRNGTDELGCESIAQVVATSSRALLHSSEGLDRETARANLAEDPQVTPMPTAAAPAVSSAPVPSPQKKRESWSLLIAARANGGYSGEALEPRYGAGLEMGLGQLVHQRWLWRVRVVFEQFMTQELATEELSASVRTSTLLMGLDVGRVRGPHTFLLGVAGGVDLMHIASDHARDTGWQLSRPGVDGVPVVRAELRYEWVISRLMLAFSGYADTALIANHFRVQEGSQVRDLATPWRVTPGGAVILGWHSQ